MICQAVYATFPNLPGANYQPDRNTENDQQGGKTQEIDSVVIHGGSPSPMVKEQPSDTDGVALSSVLSSVNGADVSKLAMELLNRLKDERNHAKEYRVLKRQYNLWLGVQSHEVATLQTELRHLQTKNEELLRQLNQAKPTNRRVSQVIHDDLDELQTQAQLIKHLKSRLGKACQIDKIMGNSYSHDWARGPSDSEGNLIKIQRGIIRLANTLRRLILSPEELDISLKSHDKGHAAVELFERSFGDIQFLFTEPWLAFRSFLFRFIRDYVFYSDLWASFHCEGFVAREYQRAIELCGEF